MRSATALIALVMVATACGGESSSAPAPTSSVTTTSPAATTTESPAATGATEPAVAATLPPTTLPPRTTGPPTPPAGEGEFATFGPAPDGVNWLQVSIRGGSSLNEQPELCLLLDGGDSGVIRMQNLSLEWNPDGWTLIWRHLDGMYDGTVTGTVDGIDVAFAGDVDGMAVRGTVTCHEA